MIGASRVILAVVLAAAATLFAGLAIMSGFRRAERKNTAGGGDMDLGELAQSAVLTGSQVDVARTRERTRRRRLWKLFVWLAPIARLLLLPARNQVNPIRLGMPHLSDDADADRPAARFDRRCSVSCSSSR